MHVFASAKRRRYLIAAASALAVTMAGQLTVAAATPAATAAAEGGNQSVIVMLRDQLPQNPEAKAASGDRHAKATSSQDSVLNGLNGPKASHVKHFTLGNAFSATVTAQQAAQLAADPAVASVSPDSKVTLPTPSPAAATAPTPSATTRSAPAAGNAQPICPSDPKKPLVEPEALTSINAYGTPNSADKLASGKGVKVAFVADNMNPNYADFIRPDGSKVFSDYQDFSGDGPNTRDAGAESYGDASSIAAQGTVVHDLSNFVNENHPLPKGCNIVVRGVAPDASLVGLNVFGKASNDSALLQAIDYAVTVDHVDVLNESLGLNEYPDVSSRNLVEQFNDNAVKAGVTVTASTGDAGITSTIGQPAADPLVISAGATTDNRLYAQTAYAAFPFSNGHWTNDDISALSSSGITNNGTTLDLVAPGEGNWSDCEPDYAECMNFKTKPSGADLQSFGGTSESAPLTAGVAALMIQAYRGTHGGASPTPALIKQLLTSTAKDLGVPSDEQGSGLIDARAAVEAAMTAQGGSGGAGVASNISVSKGQLDLQGAPGSTQKASVNVTNVGTKPLTVAAGTRQFSPLSTQTQQGNFDAKTLPQFPYYNGTQWVAKKVQFTVAAGADRLFSRLAWQGGSAKVVRMSLLAPDGTFVANSRPQGGAATPNYANVDVKHPAAGKWTAVLYAAATGTASYSGPFKLQTDTQRTVPYGQVNQPVLQLAPGQTKPVSVSMQTPATSGDAAYAVTLASSDGHQTEVPVVLRSLVQDKFSGTITGGNARAQSPGQTFSYEFDVAKGHKDLDTALNFKDAGDVLDLVLIDPNGEVADANSNIAPAAGNKTVQGKAVQSFVANPLPGRWHLVVVVQNPVTGKDIEQGFTGTVGYDKVVANASGLPAANAKAGQPVTATVQVTNPGVEPIAIGVDARTNAKQAVQPVPLGASANVDLPTLQTPGYLVPPDTNKVTLAASSTVPAQVALTSPAQGIEVFGDLRTAQGGSTVSTTQVSEKRGTVGMGEWFSGLSEIGPFGAEGAPVGRGSFTASLQTAGFDNAVTSSVGDPFLVAVDPNADGGKPVVIAPGKTVGVKVTFTPKGNRGQQVNGHLNLVTIPGQSTGDTAIPFSGSGEVVAALPYSYTIG